MKSRPSPVFLLACLFACGLAVIALPASAERVSSERSKAAPAASAPLRWRADGFPSKLVSRMQYREMPVARILQVQKNNATRRMKPVQIGINRLASNEGVTGSLPPLNWMLRKDGSSVARIEVRSPVALGLRVGLRIDALDPQAELRFAGSTEPSRIVAAMSGKEILGLVDRSRVFWTPSTDGETQFIEVYLPKGVFRTSTRLQAPQMSHLLADSRNDFKIIEKIGESGSCNVDTACRVAELGANFVSAKNAVAHMQFIIAGQGTFICTGTLLADTVSTSQIPYFYSANHCIDNQTVASTLNTFWKYEATSCGSGVEGATVQLSGGATFLYSDPDTSTTNTTNGTDGLLLRLNNMPPAGSEFAGWDSATLASSSNIIGIHHPAGDAKKVSSGQKVSIDSYQNGVGWLSGTTEGGSSGSGLFTADATGYHLRGGLYGGSASCANTGSLSNTQNRDYYSRFDVVFPHISQWLAPTPTNVAPVANFTSSTSGKVISFTDASTDSDGTIASRLWTFGDGTTSTATNPVKTYASLGVYNVTLKVTDNGGLSHSVTRNVSTSGRGRINGSQPRIHGAAAPVAQPTTKTRNTRKPSRTGLLER
ncbi:MAG TPA: PKD domain-containing protein [Pseudoxanthomonas sp.]